MKRHLLLFLILVSFFPFSLSALKVQGEDLSAELEGGIAQAVFEGCKDRIDLKDVQVHVSDLIDDGKQISFTLSMEKSNKEPLSFDVWAQDEIQMKQQIVMNLRYVLLPWLDDCGQPSIAYADDPIYSFKQVDDFSVGEYCRLVSCQGKKLGLGRIVASYDDYDSLQRIRGTGFAPGTRLGQGPQWQIGLGADYLIDTGTYGCTVSVAYSHLPFCKLPWSLFQPIMEFSFSQQKLGLGFQYDLPFSIFGWRGGTFITDGGLFARGMLETDLESLSASYAIGYRWMLNEKLYLWSDVGQTSDGITEVGLGLTVME
ncbi:MAG: DUF3187 family protein [Spirochaetia bacterium]|jgi:hypothetical protein|nr:DUF3187 family protein [Spirochaetia bacterium]